MCLILDEEELNYSNEKLLCIKTKFIHENTIHCIPIDFSPRNENVAIAIENLKLILEGWGIKNIKSIVCDAQNLDFASKLKEDEIKQRYYNHVHAPFNNDYI